jgi:hypothetical protein
MKELSDFRKLVELQAKTPLREILGDRFFEGLKNEMILRAQDNWRCFEQYAFVFEWLCRDKSFNCVNDQLAEYHAKTEFRKSIRAMLSRLNLKSKKRSENNDMVAVDAAILELELESFWKKSEAKP